MKSFTAITSTLVLLFASSAIASPLADSDDSSLLNKRGCSGSEVSIAFSNDQTGAWVPRTFCVDNIAVDLKALLQGSPINRDGKYLASSMSLTSGLANNPFCTVQDVNGDIYGPLTSQKTYFKFGSNPNQLTLIDLATKRVQCNVYGNGPNGICGGITGDAYTQCIKTGQRPHHT